MRLQVVHETRYDYTSPVTLAHHRAHLQPLDDAHQQRRSFDLDVEPAPLHSRTSLDPWGNTQCHFTVAQPHRSLTVRSTSQVRLQPRFAALDAAASPAWDDVVPRLRYVAGGAWLPAVEYVQPSPYVPRSEALRELARPSFVPRRPLADAAIELMERIHADFTYDTASTDVDTPLADVLRSRRGVCQDFAHLMAGALRMVGVPARYVSGYLLTAPPDGSAALLGADASHAWVQVWCPGTPGVPADGWLDLDPTNRVVPDVGHVRVAVGRDYGDVTPLRGVIRGSGRHTLSVVVATTVVDPAADETGPRVA